MLRSCLSDLTVRCPQWNLSSLFISRGLRDGIKISESDPVSSEEITQYLEGQGIALKTGYACIKTTCPKFTRPALKLDKLDQLYINSTTGDFSFI